METYFHPMSNISIQGMRLAPGATLRQTDVYDSTSGRWERCPIPAGVIRRGCQTVWVRPEGILSADGEVLLGYIAAHSFYLVTPQMSGVAHWRIVPEPHWKNDGRMDWEVLHPECIQDLIDFGFIAPTGDPELYEVTDAGRAAVRVH